MILLRKTSPNSKRKEAFAYAKATVIKMITPFTRSDLASEECARCMHSETEGIETSERMRESVKIQEVAITSAQGSALLGKPVGKYITLTLPSPVYMSDEEKEAAARALGEELSALIKGLPGEAQTGTALIVGLGNRRLTVDALGPAVASKITVTNHVKALDPALFEDLHMRQTSAFSPGVLGDSGFESADAISAIAGMLKPSLIIAIDALAARSYKRLACTVQLSDSGIAPGGGVGNDRKAIDRQSLGIPVFSIGVPTVIDCAAMFLEQIEKYGINEKSIPQYSEEMRDEASFFVSPKDIDAAVEELSTIIAQGIDCAMAL